jgi:hypothetical protein
LSGIATGNVLDIDTDAIGDVLSAMLVAPPANGTLDLNADGSFTYTKGDSFSGSDFFTYYASDADGDSNIATVTILGKGGGGGGSDGGGGGGKPGGDGGGNGGGGNGGGKPNRIESSAKGFSAFAQASSNGSFSIYSLPAGMEGGHAMNQTSVNDAIIFTSIAHASSQAPRSVDQLFARVPHTDHATHQPDAVSSHPASPAEEALLALAMAADHDDSSVVDQVMTDLLDTLTLPFEADFWQFDELG